MKQLMHKKKVTGFTLLEVMVTLAIIGIALVAILRSLAQSINVSDDSRNISLALFLAKGKMAEIESGGFPDMEEVEGDFGEEYPAFMWKKSIDKTAIEGLRKVVITVFWRDSGHEKKVELATYISTR